MTEPPQTSEMPQPPRTLEEKRAFAKSHLTAYAKEYRLGADVDRARAAKADAYATFVEHRASLASAMLEPELDLLIADWIAKRVWEDLQRNLRSASFRTDAILDRWLKPPVVFVGNADGKFVREEPSKYVPEESKTEKETP